MLKVLIKKQITEIFGLYFVNRKTGKARRTSQTYMLIGMFGLLILLLGSSFYRIGVEMAKILCTPPVNLGWFYYDVMAVLAIGFGVFGSIFNTYSGMFHAKDNDLLLSMPVKPIHILISRMAGTYLMSIIYEGVVMVPAFMARISVGAPYRPIGYIYPILLVFVLGFLVMAISCFLGWIVALVSSKLKNNNILTVVLSLTFMGIYYYVWMNFQKFINKIISASQNASQTIREKVYIVYSFGMGAEGDTIQFTIFTLFALIILAITCVLLSRSFFSIVTKTQTKEQKISKAKEIKENSIQKALLMKEYGRFLGSPNYMLNSGIGVVMMLAASVILLVKKDVFIKTFEQSALLKDFYPIIVVAAICAMMGTCCLSAPSISLEGKNIWIMQTLPIDMYKVLKAKVMLQFTYVLAPATISIILLFLATGESAITVTFACLMGIAFNYLSSVSSVIINIKYPNLEWTSELIPIKQGVSVIISMFGTMISGAIIGLGYYALVTYFGAVSYSIYFAVVTVITIIASLLATRWLKEKGSKIFEKL